jgi:two-component system chemotaxis sensor kinase CheA
LEKTDVDPLASIKQTFFQECEEQLSELEGGLLRIEDGDHDPELINAVFRAVHSIKGGAAAFGFDNLVDFVHVFESTLDLLRSNALEPTAAVTKILLQASDILSDLVRSARTDSCVNESNVHAIKTQLQALCAPSAEDAAGEDATGFQDLEFAPVGVSLDALFSDFAEGAEPKSAHFSIRFKPRAGLYAKANEALRLIRELTELGEATITCDTSELPFLTELDPEGAYFSWDIELATTATEADIRQVFEFVEWECDLEVSHLAEPPRGVASADAFAVDAAHTAKDIRKAETHVIAETPAKPAAEPASAQEAKQRDGQHATVTQPTIRVDLDKVDKLINLVGELVINQAMLSQRVSEAGLSRASSVVIGLDELEQLTRDIQDSVMAIRAQPVKPIFQRMSRTVREVAAITNKSVRLIVEGEGTEVDKTVIERLTDPLTHMVRNAVDHGIESPEARVAAGKSEEGTLRLSAMHRSGRIVIEVSDDGAGINRKRVREIAISKGLISEDAALTDEETDNLIFLPGFSTNDTASAISGRGVGMDVVKRAIQALGGRITISSRYGYGSSFSMSLPLTLAVLDGMVVTVAGQTLVLPLTAVIETLQPKHGNVHSLGVDVRMIASRNSFIPLVDIGRELLCRTDDVDPTSQVALLVESENRTKCALLVDAIQGQRQVVIKSLETNYGRVRGIAAATILGDGRVALILDVDAIVGGLRPDAQGMDGGAWAAE